MSPSVHHVPSARTRALRFVAAAHALRAAGAGAGFFMVAAVFWRHGAALPVWVLLAINGFAWPHFARLLAQRSADPARTERSNVLVDAFMCGVWLVLMRFDLLPSVAMLAMEAATCVAAGGTALMLRGLGVQVLSGALVVATGGFVWAPQTTMPEILATLPFLISYPLILSGITYGLTQRVRRQNRALARISSIDGLSELLNRGHWEESVERVLAAGNGSGGVATLLMIDIDHFKQINDRYGHTVGDEVIGRIGAIIRRNMREGDIAGRYGGDEFGVVLNGVDAATAALIAERIRVGINAAGFDHAADLRCTLSIGIAQSGEGARDVRTWVRQADAALYNAKLRGRNQLASNADAWQHDADAA
ncbi:MAG: diguanylate cyclase [Proteobacteria bacterium]|nr:diguanylate cyclase [Pseudomonadota bacterium]